MSSEIYELMKRSDEAHVVEKAHRRPRFVEDCVREMIRGVVDAFPSSPTRRSSRPARRTSRRSTSTTWSPSASARSARSARELADGVPPGATRAAGPGSTPSRRDADRDRRTDRCAPWSSSARASRSSRDAPRPRARRRAAATRRSKPARSAAPTCTCATPRSRRRSSRSCSATRSSGSPTTAAASACPWLGWTDGDCRYCTTGRENLCVNARFTGRDIDGGFAELTVADERYCLALPDDLTDEQAAPLLVRRADRLPRAELHRRRDQARAVRVRLGRAP